MNNLEQTDVRKWKTIVGSVIATNGGHDRARIVREAGPDGATAVHPVSLTGRAIDRLLVRRQITQAQHEAATRLREDWERSGLVVARMGAVDLDRGGGGEASEIADERAFRRYRDALESLHPAFRDKVQSTVCWDSDPWGFNALPRMRMALNALARHYGATDGDE